MSARSIDKTQADIEWRLLGIRAAVRGRQGRKKEVSSITFGCELRINSPGLRSTGGVTAAAGKKKKCSEIS